MSKKKTVNRAVRAREHADMLAAQRTAQREHERANAKITLSIGSFVVVKPIGGMRRKGQSATPWQNKVARIQKFERKHGYTVALVCLQKDSQAQIWLPLDEIAPYIPKPKEEPAYASGLRTTPIGPETPANKIPQWLSDIR